MKIRFGLIVKKETNGILNLLRESLGLETTRKTPADIVRRGGPTGEVICSEVVPAIKRWSATKRKRLRALLAGVIDHTLLKPEATQDDIERVCAEALKHKFCSVCVNPVWVRHCAKLLGRGGVKLCTVVGFPLGANSPDVKACEAETAVRDGAREIDMVLNIGALRRGNNRGVKDDIASVVDAVSGKALVKVIMETAVLAREQKIAACVAATEAGANYVKTSTGFASGGATVEDVELLAAHVPPTMGVKASGGIRNLETVFKMIVAGATRIGSSAGPAILVELEV